MRAVRVAMVLSLLLAVAGASGCTPGTKTGLPAAPRPISAPPSTLQTQATWLKGSPARLTPIPGAQAWLRSADLSAYRDSSGAELVYDTRRDRILSWEPGYRTVTTSDPNRPQGYGVTDGTAAGFADKAVAPAYKGDLGMLRRRVRHFDHGGGPQFDFVYDRYENGVRLQDHASVSASGHTGHAGRLVSAFTRPAPPANALTVGMPLKTAVEKAAAAKKLGQWKFVSADLAVLPSIPSQHAIWTIRLKNTTPVPAGLHMVDGDEPIVMIDAVTGEVVGVAG